MSPVRRDLAFPFRVDPVSAQTAQSPYAVHVDQLVRQLLLTSPGERVNLPQFGCGLRALVFAPLTDALGATLKIRVLQAFQTWLSGVASLLDVVVATSAEGGVPEPGTVQVTVTYTVVETQTPNSVTVTVI
jgi:phage baseplate assembly protein W